MPHGRGGRSQHGPLSGETTGEAVSSRTFVRGCTRMAPVPMQPQPSIDAALEIRYEVDAESPNAAPASDRARESLTAGGGATDHAHALPPPPATASHHRKADVVRGRDDSGIGQSAARGARRSRPTDTPPRVGQPACSGLLQSARYRFRSGPRTQVRVTAAAAKSSCSDRSHSRMDRIGALARAASMRRSMRR